MTLAAWLLQAVAAQDLRHTADRQRQGAPVAHHPSIDLAVVQFSPGQPPRAANVLFSREHPRGAVATFGPGFGPVDNIRFDADVQDAQGASIAWQPAADWRRIGWQPLLGAGLPAAAPRFVAPYPASLLKLMVAVGVAMSVDRGLCGWPAALEPMLVVSDNDATTECVALLHRLGLLGGPGWLNQRFAQLGLPTLQMHGTQAGGGWRNADGAGVGRIHMTAWDTARLLWLLDMQAPAPPWLAPGTRLLRPATAGHLHGVLRRQQLDEVLSSGALRGLPGWVPGLPDAPAFAHKTGTTDNYASDAGIVQADGAHYVVAVLTSLGRRYAPVEAVHGAAQDATPGATQVGSGAPESTDPGPPPRRGATTWRLPALGAAIHRLITTGSPPDHRSMTDPA